MSPRCDIKTTKPTKTMQPTCKLVRRRITRRSPLKKSLTAVAEIIGTLVMFALLIALAVLVMAL